MLTKMEWFGTMFPRISVNVQKEIQEKIKELERSVGEGNDIDSHSNDKNY